MADGVFESAADGPGLVDLVDFVGRDVEVPVSDGAGIGGAVRDFP